MNDQGGDSSSVQHRLDGKVTHIAATTSAFAAILVDGSVVTWGYFEEGGDASEVQNQLQNVVEIEGNGYAFAARLVNGSVVSWGEQIIGRDGSCGQHQLQSVQKNYRRQCGPKGKQEWVDEESWEGEDSNVAMKSHA
eukprot:s178_g51.t1